MQTSRAIRLGLLLAMAAMLGPAVASGQAKKSIKGRRPPAGACAGRVGRAGPPPGAHQGR